MPMRKCIYFVDGANPTQEDFDAAEKIGKGVVFRNARRIVPGAPLENCDAVAGAIPDDYASVYPSVEQYKDDQENENVKRRPRAARTTSSGGPDDQMPGTIDTGIAHESGTGSQFNPEQQQQRDAVMDQRQGRDLWEKNTGGNDVTPTVQTEQQSGDNKDNNKDNKKDGKKG